jgi:hypothetical protein
MSNKIQNTNVLKKEMKRNQNEKRISNIEQGILNFEGRFAVHRLRFTKLFSFRAFEISWFRDHLFWDLAFVI